MAKIVLVRKRGTRKDGRNYVVTCTLCWGAKSDVSGVLGISKEQALEMAQKHCDIVHNGETRI